MVLQPIYEIIFKIRANSIWKNNKCSHYPFKCGNPTENPPANNVSPCIVGLTGPFCISNDFFFKTDTTY